MEKRKNGKTKEWRNCYCFFFLLETKRSKDLGQDKGRRLLMCGSWCEAVSADRLSWTAVLPLALPLSLPSSFSQQNHSSLNDCVIDPGFSIFFFKHKGRKMQMRIVLRVFFFVEESLIILSDIPSIFFKLFFPLWFSVFCAVGKRPVEVKFRTVKNGKHSEKIRARKNNIRC